jgi:hypothetical protein
VHLNARVLEVRESDASGDEKEQKQKMLSVVTDDAQEGGGGGGGRGQLFDFDRVVFACPASTAANIITRGNKGNVSGKNKNMYIYVYVYYKVSLLNAEWSITTTKI